VDVPEKHVSAVMGKSGKIKLHKYPVEITK
jgi:hypothetical protein